MSGKELAQRLYYMPKPTRWSSGIGAELPEAYKKFWKEWKLTEPTAVHYVKQEGTYVRNEETEKVYPVQNVPIPLKYPKEFNEGIWGGEAVIQGFQKRNRLRRRVPHFWFPNLMRSVVYSEVLDTYMSVVVTRRTIHLVNENYGFDHYLLKTPACDLRSELAVRIKRNILLALADKTLYPNDPEKRETVYNQYKEYLTAYTREEIEWYGLSYKDACKKWIKLKAEAEEIQPLKIQYRSDLLTYLKENNIEELQGVDVIATQDRDSSWLKKLNPFTKRPKQE